MIFAFVQPVYGKNNKLRLKTQTIEFELHTLSFSDRTLSPISTKSKPRAELCQQE